MIKIDIIYIIVRFQIFHKFTISFMDSHKFTSLTHTQHSWVKRTMVFFFFFFGYLVDIYFPLTDLFFSSSSYYLCSITIQISIIQSDHIYNFVADVKMSHVQKKLLQFGKPINISNYFQRLNKTLKFFGFPLNTTWLFFFFSWDFLFTRYFF